MSSTSTADFVFQFGNVSSDSWYVIEVLKDTSCLCYLKTQFVLLSFPAKYLSGRKSWKQNLISRI